MKICWDTLEKVRYNKKTGTFRIGGCTYYEHNACSGCDDPYIGRKNSECCSNKCARTGKNHPMFSRTLTEEHKSKLITSHSKGGVTAKNIPLYDTFTPQLEPYEKCMRDPEDPLILNVFCTYSGCKKQFRPTRSEVKNRISGINDNDTRKFYCSPECKQVCPLFHQSAQSLMERDAELADIITKLNKRHIRTYQIENKKRRYKANGGICDMCEIEVSTRSSILHHEVPVTINFLVADDTDNHWLFCKKCDKKVHVLDGCGYYEIRRKRMCAS